MVDLKVPVLKEVKALGLFKHGLVENVGGQPELTLNPTPVDSQADKKITLSSDSAVIGDGGCRYYKSRFPTPIKSTGLQNLEAQNGYDFRNYLLVYGTENYYSPNAKLGIGHYLYQDDLGGVHVIKIECDILDPGFWPDADFMTLKVTRVKAFNTIEPDLLENQVILDIQEHILPIGTPEGGFGSSFNLSLGPIPQPPLSSYPDGINTSIVFSPVTSCQFIEQTLDSSFISSNTYGSEYLLNIGGFTQGRLPANHVTFNAIFTVPGSNSFLSGSSNINSETTVAIKKIVVSGNKNTGLSAVLSDESDYTELLSGTLQQTFFKAEVGFPINLTTNSTWNTIFCKLYDTSNNIVDMTYNTQTTQFISDYTGNDNGVVGQNISGSFDSQLSNGSNTVTEHAEFTSSFANLMTVGGGVQSADIQLINGSGTFNTTFLFSPSPAFGTLLYDAFADAFRNDFKISPAAYTKTGGSTFYIIAPLYLDDSRNISQVPFPAIGTFAQALIVGTISSTSILNSGLLTSEFNILDVTVRQIATFQPVTLGYVQKQTKDFNLRILQFI